MMDRPQAETEDQDPHLPRPVSRLAAAVAMVISFVFHPVFMPTLLTYAVYRFVPASFAGFDEKAFQVRFLLPVFIATAFFPILSVLLMKALKFVESIHLYKPKDRIIPLIAAMVFYFWIYHVAKNTDAPFLLQVLLLGAFWGVIALFIVNVFYKVSMHSAGAGSMIGMVIVLLLTSPISMTIPLFLSLGIAGLVGTARLLLGAHRSYEIWLGYILGTLVQVSAYFYLS